MSELKAIIQDVKEQVAFLRELGVETLAEPPVIQSKRAEPPTLVGGPGAPINSTLRPPAHAGGSAPDAQPRVSRLSSLPTLADRAVKVSRPQPVENTAMPTMTKEKATNPVETIEQIQTEIGPDCT